MSTMKSAQAVYYGPGFVLYPSAGSVASGEVVTALWKRRHMVLHTVFCHN